MHPINLQPVTAIHRMAARMHGREHTWVPTPAVLMAGGVMGMPSAGGMPKKVVPFWHVLSVVWCGRGVILGQLPDVLIWTGIW